MFRLLRFFSLASLASIAVAALLLGILYRQVALGNLLEMGERSNVSLANSLANTLSEDYTALLDVATVPTDAAQMSRVLSRLENRVIDITRGMSVVKVKIYDRRGKTVFSSEARQIGEDKKANAGFQAALAGRPASELSHRDKFSAFEQTIVNRDLISSYVPVRLGPGQEAVAVFELYDDVTPLLAQLAATQFKIVAGVLLVLASLYGALFLVVRRADKILHMQHARLLRNETDLERARSTLEQRVADRTQALEGLNAKLSDEIEQRRGADKKLVEARRAAESASVAKSQFLSSMSHEIRTPLNGVLGMTELLIHTRLDGEQARYVEVISTAARSLHGLLSDILDLTKIEEGQIELERTDFQLHALLSEIADAYHELATSRGLVLVKDFQHAPDWVCGDPGRLRQVLTNLLGNAIKFTERGEVRLRVENLPAQAGDGRAWQRFTVEDTGIGIARDAMEKLFRRFGQADASTTRKFGGSGLGLVICKLLVELMGGEIHVHSTPGQGSRFWFDLPLDAALDTRPVIATPAIAALPGNARVLVAEDNQVNQQVIKGLLGHLGVLVTVAENGALALEQVQRTEFELVLMDCQMPVMDGFEATRRIRAWEQGQPGRRPVPVIALTANALSGDREACLEAGMNDYLAKPVTMANLSTVLGRYLHAGGDAGSTAGPGGQDRLSVAGQDAAVAVPAFDPAVLAALPMVADGSEAEFANQILGLFVDGAGAAFAAIERAHRDNDAPVFTRAVHTLKSSAAQVGASALSLEATRQERLLRTGLPMQADWPALLRRAFEAFELALAAHRQGVAEVIGDRHAAAQEGGLDAVPGDILAPGNHYARPDAQTQDTPAQPHGSPRG